MQVQRDSEKTVIMGVDKHGNHKVETVWRDNFFSDTQYRDRVDEKMAAMAHWESV